MRLRSLLRRIHEIGWGLSLETVLELILARLWTLLPARYYIGAESRLPRINHAGPLTLHEAHRIGSLVEAISRLMPFRAVCLQQALVSRRMLLRRGYPAVLCLGVSKTQEDRVAPSSGRAAHAWVCIGEHVVCGDIELDRYALLAQYQSC